MTKKQNLETIIVLSGALIIGHFIFQLTALLQAALLLLIIAIVSPKATSLISKKWMQLAEILGKFVSTILLTIIFFLVITPISFIYRLIKKDFLKIHKEYKTYYTSRNHTFTATDLENTW